MSVAAGMVTSMERKIWMAAELEAKNRTADLLITNEHGTLWRFRSCVASPILSLWR